MTIVDEHGKLFKIINLFDLFLLIILVVVCVFGTIKIVKRYTVTQQMEYYLMDIRAINLDEVIVPSLKKGDIFRHANGSPFGIVINEPVSRPTQVYVTTPQGTLVARTQPKLRDVDFTMVIQVTAGTKEIKYGNQTFKAGATGFLETYLSKYTVLVCSIKPFKATDSFPNPFFTKPSETINSTEETEPGQKENQNP